MEEKAIIFIDYNETFDDIAEGKGKVFFSALRRFAHHFHYNIEIVVITSAKKMDDEHFSIKGDLSYTLSRFPSNLIGKFKYLVEEDNKYITPIFLVGNCIKYGKSILMSTNNGTKKDGVEQTLKIIDPNKKCDTCVFIGNDEISDLTMLDANVGEREKYFLLANKRVLKASKYPVFKLSMCPRIESQLNLAKEVKTTTKFTANEGLIIKTGEKSYGVGRALEVVTSLLEEKERQ